MENIKRNSEIKPTLASVLLFCLCFLLLLLPDPLIDPDFGWHLRNGEHIATTFEVPKIDHFSHTRPGFMVVSHEWFQDLLLFTSFDFLGLAGVRIWYASLLIFGLFLPLTCFSSVRLSKESIATAALILVALSLGLKLFRPQLVTAIGFTLILLLIEKLKNDNSSRSLAYIPPLFLVWANSHGGFPVGFVTIGLVTAAETVKLFFARKRLVFAESKIFQTKFNERGIILLVVVSLISLALTLLNPFGFGLYEEILRTMLDSSGRAAISEWLPASFEFSTGELLFVFTLAYLFLIYFKREERDFTNFILATVFFIFALSASRHATFFVIFVVARCVVHFHQVDGIFKEYFFTTFKFASITIIAIIGFYQFSPNALSVRPTWSREAIFPVEALAHIDKELLQNSKIFNYYGWGGYLLWHNPKIKTFIDGRMVHWKEKNSSIFEEYQSVLNNNENAQFILERYDVSLVIVPTPAKIVERLSKENDKWENLYRDDVATVFKKL